MKGLGLTLVITYLRAGVHLERSRHSVAGYNYYHQRY
jgi:hypothetical protein